MITEDYVSFESSKLLKEKGFDGKCDYLYVDGKLVRALGCACNWNDGETLFADYKNECSAPTIQMAMKWLREVYNIHIEVTYFFEPHIYKYTITYTPVALNSVSSHPQCFNTYEEACEAAIEYCLKNLI